MGIEGRIAEFLAEADTVAKDELLDRLHRIYAALNAAVEGDLSKFPPKVIADEHQFALYQDFLGGLTAAQLSNLAHSIVHNIANLQYHLQRWAAKNGRDPNDIHKMAANSPELQIIIDLSNNDKHGYPLRNGGRSGKAPKLLEVKRVLRLSTGPGPGSSVAIVFTSSGPKQIASGGGSSNVVVTGPVVDQNDAPLGDLYEIGNEALKAWEQQLHALGILN